MGQADFRGLMTGQLTAREREIVTLVAQGYSTPEIANRFRRSAKTIDAHLENIKAKTGTRNRAMLARYAIQQGWLGEK